jgi:hypothetical protein
VPTVANYNPTNQSKNGRPVLRELGQRKQFFLIKAILHANYATYFFVALNIM